MNANRCLHLDKWRSVDLAWANPPMLVKSQKNQRITLFDSWAALYLSFADAIPVVLESVWDWPGLKSPIVLRSSEEPRAPVST